MTKNWLAAAWAHWFRAEPLVPDVAFQDVSEPHPGHWRQFPEPWPATADPSHVNQGPAPAAGGTQLSGVLDAALTELPVLWGRVVMARALNHGNDRRVAAQLGLTLEQERDILARARAAVRDRLDRARTAGGGS
jgi:DNA-directed RNA polymerase specialized sigma24 family protein